MQTAMPATSIGNEKQHDVLAELNTALVSLKAQNEQSLTAICSMLGILSRQTLDSLPVVPTHVTDVQVEVGTFESLDGAGKRDANGLVGGLVQVESPSVESLTNDEAVRQNSSVLSRVTSFQRGEEIAQQHVCRRFCKRVIDNPCFDYSMGFVVLLNSISIGIEVQESISVDGTLGWPENLDLVFLFFYTVEIAMHLIVEGKAVFKDNWFLFDFLVTSLGWLTGILMPLVMLIAGMQTNGGLVEQIMVVRSLRLLRLFRAVRMLKYFRTVWRLIHGLLTSGNAMLSTVGLLSLSIYIMACIGVELITKDKDLQRHESTREIVEVNFGNLFRTLLTLVSFVCADSVSGIYTPLVLVKPGLWIYFCFLLVFITIALMNLVTAVLVEGALDQAKEDSSIARHDQEQAVLEALPKLLEAFKNNDRNNDGTLTLDEVICMDIETLVPQPLLDKHGIKSFSEVFEILDDTGDGSVDQMEFVDGILNLFVTDHSVQQLQILKLMRRTCERSSQAMEAARSNQDKLDTLQRTVMLVLRKLEEAELPYCT
eukprot:TRINITY_DN8517_c0_g2_i3.p1 TRINITY_DN8517_c0_g2~~TRINITY_DN8517_c0_g2_i3.p1  ORF type:complete len:541 (-),score=81.33 TRINITY_DN8517_c0_g2_i3:253-1875(-)